MVQVNSAELEQFRVVRIRDAEQGDDGMVTVLRPRFLRGPLAWWLQPRLPKPYYRVCLDEIGSFVWQRCDGEQTVAQIAAAMELQFGDEAELAMKRLVLFLGQMERGQLVQLVPPEE